MKTLNFAIIAMLFAFTLATFSSSAQGMKEKPNFKKVVVLSFENAMKDANLIKAMYFQLSEQDFEDAHQHIYFADVIYRGSTYHITGTFDQWKRFFWYDSRTPLKKKLTKGGSTE